VVREAVLQSLPPAQVIWLVPYILPQALQVTMPVTLLLATTIVYGRMSGANEVLAIKAMGIHPMRIVWPTLVGAFLLSLLAVWLNDIAVSWGRHGVQRVLLEAVEEIAYSMLRTQRSYSSPSFAINVKRIDGRRLILPTLTLQARGNTPTITIMAQEAEMQADYKENVLKIVLRQGTIDVEGRLKASFPDVHEQEIPLSDASRADSPGSRPSVLALALIPGQIVKQRELIERYEQELAAQAAYQMLSGEFDSLVGPQWDEHYRQLQEYRQNLHRLRAEPHRRWSAGFSCLCFVWVGASMAIWLRNRDFMTSFFLCFLPILVVYYPAMMGAVDGAKNGTIPPWGVWAGNLLLVLGGLVLLRKVLRY
jgi:lipopolysaccharide export system permease protein